MIPVDFPAEPLGALLDELRISHEKAPLEMLQQTRTDEGVELTLLALRVGSVYLQLFFTIRNDDGDLGVPFEAELCAGEDERCPLFRAEMPWWHDVDGVATLLAPRPRDSRRFTLRIRQVRMFSTGPGSRALKVRALAPRPLQAPPIRLSPGDEERYRASLRTTPPSEPHKDVYGYWDFEFSCPSLAAEPIVAADGTLRALGQNIAIWGRGRRTLYGRLELPWDIAYRTPPVWDGLSTVELISGLAGIGSFQPCGDVVWTFPEDLPDTINVSQVNLYRIPANPPLLGAGEFHPRPFPGGIQYDLVVEDLTVLDLLLGSQGGEKAIQQFLHGQVHVKTDRKDCRIRPFLRFWDRPDKSDRYDAPTLWKTPLGEYFFPVANTPAKRPQSWDAPFANILIPQVTSIVTVKGKAVSDETPLAFIPPNIYSTSPMRLV